MKTGGTIILYLLKSFGKLALVLLAVSLVCFALVSASPVDPVRAFLGEIGMQSVGAETIGKLRSYFSMDISLPERYWNWISDFIRGDMGISLIYRQPVSHVIGERFINSFALMMSAWLFSGILGFAMGIAAGARRGTLMDKCIKGYSLVLASTPTFWLALVALMVFSVWLGWFPIGFSAPIGVDDSAVTFGDTLRHLALPALTLSVIGVANIALHTREKMIDIMEEDYVRFARAQGESTFSIAWHHGTRNALLPALTLQFASIGEIFGGSVLVEQVFSYRGLGQAAVNAGLSGDAPLLLGIAMVSAVMVFGGNMMANILYGVVDPRIRKGVAL